MTTTCARCHDTGLRLVAGEESKTYCDCPVGLAYCEAWSGTGHEEERVEAIDKMLAFLRAPSVLGEGTDAPLPLGDALAERAAKAESSERALRGALEAIRDGGPSMGEARRIASRALVDPVNAEKKEG